jgi:hypothetical protein
LYRTHTHAVVNTHKDIPGLSILHELTPSVLSSVSLETIFVMDHRLNDLERLLGGISLGDMGKFIRSVGLGSSEESSKAKYLVSEFGLGNTDGRRMTFYPVSEIDYRIPADFRAQ